MQQNTEQAFVVDLLTTLRRGRFSARAWGRFFKRSWLLSCQTAADNPTLKQSWLRVTCLMTLLALLILLGNALYAGLPTTLPILPGFALCVAWQQSDLFWHLGLNRSVQSGKLLPTIGIANTLTWLRALGASYLLGRLSAGLATPASLALTIFLCGIVTDILDGQIARHRATQSKLGQIADAETDFCLYLALTSILLQNGILPLWIGLIMLLRFVIPILAALVSYLAFAQPLRFGSTWWGKCAGLAQCLYFLLLLTPPSLSFIAHPLNTPLLIITLCLLVAAPVAQLSANWREQ